MDAIYYNGNFKGSGISKKLQLLPLKIIDLCNLVQMT